MLKIDDLSPGDKVLLDFTDGSPAESATFVEICGDGADRRACFRTTDKNGTYEWEAYRYMSRWAYGTGADRLRLMSRDN